MSDNQSHEATANDFLVCAGVLQGIAARLPDEWPTAVMRRVAERIMQDLDDVHGPAAAYVRLLALNGVDGARLDFLVKHRASYSCGVGNACGRVVAAALDGPKDEG